MSASTDPIRTLEATVRKLETAREDAARLKFLDEYCHTIEVFNPRCEEPTTYEQEVGEPFLDMVERIMEDFATPPECDLCKGTGIGQHGDPDTSKCVECRGGGSLKDKGDEDMSACGRTGYLKGDGG